MEEDIQTFSQTVMFRGTPCIHENHNFVFLRFLALRKCYKNKFKLDFKCPTFILFSARWQAYNKFPCPIK